MYEILLAFHVLIALVLIIFILIQHGKGAQAGAAFGSGASQTVFGSQGSGGFLSRATGSLAAIFFALNLFLAYFINKTYPPEIRGGSTQEKQGEGAQQKTPTSVPHPEGTDIPD